MDGHPILLDVFDDRSSAEGALANAPAIVGGPAVAVLGHLLSSASVAAGAAYQAARIPALTGVSTADEVTMGNPWYFRAQTPNTVQGQWLAYYIRNILQGRSSLFARAADIDLVVSKDAFGQSFARGYIAGSEGRPPKIWTFDNAAQAADASAGQIAKSLAQEPEPRIIVLGVSVDHSPDLVKAIRRHGIRTILVVIAAGTDDYLQRFENEPEERDTPGFFTDNLYTTASVIFDTIGALGPGLRRTATPPQPASGRAGSPRGGNDAMRFLVEALRRAHIRATPGQQGAGPREDPRRARQHRQPRACRARA